MDRLSDTIQQVAKCGQLLKLLLDELNELLDAPADPDDRPWIVAVVKQILENLQQQFELEESRGYLADVLERYPNWHPQVEQLEREQRLLQRHLRESLARLEREAAQGAVSRESRRQLRDWVTSYREHERREANLIQEAFVLEVGSGE